MLACRTLGRAAVLLVAIASTLPVALDAQVSAPGSAIASTPSPSPSPSPSRASRDETAPRQATPAATAAATAAQSPATLAAGEVNPEAARLIDQVMSPFCPGLVLTNCPSLSADSLRRAIRARFDAGATREQVMQELSATYGDAIRSAPAQSGFGLLAWVVPGGLVLVGALVMTMFIRRRRPEAPAPRAATPAAPGTGSPPSALDDALAARLRDG
ncbi:MAG: cytochrome c-type biogenesis protein CcmH [Gemmatimonadetes bacterium]|nr:cytochrome c-type biogenesis protein CcmH [Gemmatimonadota bacterium]